MSVLNRVLSEEPQRMLSEGRAYRRSQAVVSTVRTYDCRPSVVVAVDSCLQLLFELGDLFLTDAPDPNGSFRVAPPRLKNGYPVGLTGAKAVDSPDEVSE